MILNLTLGLVSLIGIALTIYYGRKSAKLEKAKKTLYWHDLQTISDSISLSLRRDNFIPEIILSPGLRGGILAELLINRFGRNIPVFAGISYRYYGKTAKLGINGYQNFIIQEDWDILIPKSVVDFKDKRILIVDDFCLTGEFFQSLRQYLIDNGFEKDKIRVFCAVVTSVAQSAGRMPEYYSIITESDFFYFPWGKANIR